MYGGKSYRSDGKLVIFSKIIKEVNILRIIRVRFFIVGYRS